MEKYVMKKAVLVIAVFFIGVLFHFLITRYADNTEEKALYEIPKFTEELCLTVDNRLFKAEDVPENEAEETIFRDRLAEFLKSNALREQSIPKYGELFEIELKNRAENDKTSGWITTLILHEIETLPSDFDSDGYLKDLETAIEEYHLTDARIVRLQWTEEWEEPNPSQYGNGTFERLYIVGKTQKDPLWKIYEVSFM